MTLDQKYALRTSQFVIARMKNEVTTLLEKIKRADAAFQKEIEALASEMKVDPATQQFNLDTLEFEPIREG